MPIADIQSALTIISATLNYYCNSNVEWVYSDCEERMKISSLVIQ